MAFMAVALKLVEVIGFHFELVAENCLSSSSANEARLEKWGSMDVGVNISNGVLDVSFKVDKCALAVFSGVKIDSVFS